MHVTEETCGHDNALRWRGALFDSPPGICHVVTLARANALVQHPSEREPS